MATPAWRALLALALAAQSAASIAAPEAGSNLSNYSIQQVQEMLEDIRSTITAEGEAGAGEYEAYQAYCQNESAKLAADIVGLESTISSQGSDMDAAKALKAGLDAEVEQEQSDLAKAKTKLVDATANCERLAAEFHEEKDETTANIDAIRNALLVLKGAPREGLLQTGAAVTLRKILSSSGHLLDAAMGKPQLLSVLAGTQSRGPAYANYVPQAGEVVGILETLADVLTKDLNQAVDRNTVEMQSCGTLKEATEQDIGVLTQSIERKMGESANAGIRIAALKTGLSDNYADLLEHRAEADQLNAACASKTSEWEESARIRNKELATIAEIIKLLGDEDALELFTALPPTASASFVQLAGSGTARSRALQILRAASNGDHGGMRRMSFIGLALKGETVGIDKVILMIDDIVNIIKEEQLNNENDKTNCQSQRHASRDNAQRLGWRVADITEALADISTDEEEVSDTIAKLEDEASELQSNEEDLQQLRNDDHAQYFRLKSDNRKANQLLELARKRLLQLYTPQLRQTTTATQARDDQIYKGTFLAQKATIPWHSDRPVEAIAAAAPDAPEPYAKQAEKGTGVIAMIDLLMQSLDAEMRQAETNEQHGQETYDAQMKESSERRGVVAKRLADLQVQGARLSVERVARVEENATAAERHQDAEASAARSMNECQAIIDAFSSNTDARTKELDALAHAKAVLSGADYTSTEGGLLQASASKVRRHLRDSALQAL